MKNRVDKKKGSLLRCLLTSLVFCIICVCYSCTTPDAVYAAAYDIADQTEQIVVKGPVYPMLEEAEEPALILEQENTKYQLVSRTLSEAVIEGVQTYVSASIPYELEGQQCPPETTVITLYDERTNSKYQRMLSFLEIKETDRLWEETFSFPITVSGYDSAYYQLGSMLVAKEKNLIDYSDQILESMGLSKDYYSVKTITWSGEPYEKDGEIVRDALAEGEKLIRRVDVKYGGEIKTPDTVGYQYVSIYESIGESELVKEDGKAEKGNLLDHEDDLSEQIQRFLKEHMFLIKISGIFVLLIISAIYLLWMSKKSVEKKKSQELS